VRKRGKTRGKGGWKVEGWGKKLAGIGGVQSPLLVRRGSASRAMEGDTNNGADRLRTRWLYNSRVTADLTRADIM